MKPEVQERQNIYGWRIKALNLAETLIKILRYQSEKEGKKLTFPIIRKHFSMDNIYALYRLRNEIPSKYIDGISDYLRSLPFMTDEQLEAGTFVNQVRENNGYLAMQLTHAFDSLEREYGDAQDVDFFTLLSDRLMNKSSPAKDEQVSTDAEAMEG